MTRLGVIGVGIHDPATWSGSPAGLQQGLRELGLDLTLVDADPPRAVRAACRAWVAATRGPASRWRRSPVMIGARQEWVRSQLLTRHPAAWVQIGSEMGRPVRRARYVTFDDMTVAQARRIPNPFFDGIPSRWFDAWQRRQGDVFRHAHACCVATQWAADSVVSDYGVAPGRVHVVGIGANLVSDQPADRDWSTPRFLFLGRDWQRKNGPAVVSAFAALRAEVPSATLDVVGEHPPLDGPGVQGHGPLSQSVPAERERLESLLRTATCLVVPSISEPFGIVYLEAGAAGVPSIGTSVGGAREPIGDGGIVVDPNDHAALLDAMRQLADPATAARLGGLASEHSRQFTWKQVASRVVDQLG